MFVIEELITVCYAACFEPLEVRGWGSYNTGEVVLSSGALVKTTCYHEVTGSALLVYWIPVNHCSHSDVDAYCSCPTKCLCGSGPLTK